MDNIIIAVDNKPVTPSVEQVVSDYKIASAELRKKYNTPAKARQFLIKVGILEKHTGSKNGVRLAGPYRELN